MGKKRKTKRLEETISCVAYLSTEGELYSADKREKKQLQYIKDYANAHNIKIKKIFHRDIVGQNILNAHWSKMVLMVRKGMADGIIVANMQSVSSSVPDAFYKVGQIYEAGGIVVTVDEGRLSMPIRKLVNGRMVLANEVN